MEHFLLFLHSMYCVKFLKFDSIPLKPDLCLNNGALSTFFAQYYVIFFSIQLQSNQLQFCHDGISFLVWLVGQIGTYMIGNAACPNGNGYGIISRSNRSAECVDDRGRLFYLCHKTARVMLSRCSWLKSPPSKMRAKNRSV